MIFLVEKILVLKKLNELGVAFGFFQWPRLGIIKLIPSVEVFAAKLQGSDSPTLPRQAAKKGIRLFVFVEKVVHNGTKSVIFFSQTPNLNWQHITGFGMNVGPPKHPQKGR